MCPTFKDNLLLSVLCTKKQDVCGSLPHTAGLFACSRQVPTTHALAFISLEHQQPQLQQHRVAVFVANVLGVTLIVPFCLPYP